MRQDLLKTLYLESVKVKVVAKTLCRLMSFLCSHSAPRLSYAQYCAFSILYSEGQKFSNKNQNYSGSLNYLLRGFLYFLYMTMIHTTSTSHIRLLSTVYVCTYSVCPCERLGRNPFLCYNISKNMSNTEV